MNVSIVYRHCQPLNNLECCRNTFTDKNDTDIVVHDSDEIIDDNSMAQIIDMTEGFDSPSVHVARLIATPIWPGAKNE
jgi:hypothetical protein